MVVVWETMWDAHSCKHIAGFLHTPPYGDLVRTGDKVPDGANFIVFAYCPECGAASKETIRKQLTGRPQYVER